MDEQDLTPLLDAFRDVPGATLPLLHAVQARFGHIPPAFVPAIAAAAGCSAAEVRGCLDFYADFHTAPRGRHRVQVCRAEACLAEGAASLVAHAEGRLGVSLGETTGDGLVSLEGVYCLGNCAAAPSIRIDDSCHARVDAVRFDTLVDNLQAELPMPNDTRDRTHEGTIVYVPADTTAGALGADLVAGAIAACAPALRVIRNGSRGACWLEPLVEVARDGSRTAIANVAEAAVPALVDAIARGTERTFPGAVGDIDAHPWFAGQVRHTFRRVGADDPLDVAAWRAAGGGVALERALAMAPHDIVAAVEQSGLRGRGGAGFPAGIKWRTVLECESVQKYVVCNADEGDSGTYADRLLMEGDPYQLIEAMAIAGIATGADKGYIYLRSEYPRAHGVLGVALDRARQAGWLGQGVAGSDRPFDIELRLGAGSYVCGEETALLESLEGKRGTVRAKPPVPAIAGLFGQPTLVHNVLTLAAVTSILGEDGDAWTACGHAGTNGTLAYQLAGNVARGGLVEAPAGMSLRELVEGSGGGTRSGRPIGAVQVGGPLGAWLGPAELDVAMDFDTLAAAGGLLGHGGIVVFDDTIDARAMARYAFEFCAEESCGKCTPCRIGSTRGAELLAGPAVDRVLVSDLCDTMEAASLCSMGGLTPLPVRSLMRLFPAAFDGDNGSGG